MIADLNLCNRSGFTELEVLMIYGKMGSVERLP